MACAGTRFACLMALLTYVCSPGAPEGTPSKAAAAAAVHRLLGVRCKTARGSASSGHMWQLEKYEVVIFMKKVPHVLPQPSGGAGARFLRPAEVYCGYRVFSARLIPNAMRGGGERAQYWWVFFMRAVALRMPSGLRWDDVDATPALLCLGGAPGTGWAPVGGWGGAKTTP